MLSNKGFDLWADGYDKSVNLCDEVYDYPFAGYKNVLNTIFNLIHTKKKAIILDIGFGTATLTKKLYDDGYKIWGIDFSAKMIEIGKAKMPNAKLIQYDFSNGLPDEITNQKFDFIISTYALHHLNDDAKIIFINNLQKLLNKNGMLIIGDIAFETRKLHDKCKLECGDGWDSDEFYFIYEELNKHIDLKSYMQISHCAGVMIISQNSEMIDSIKHTHNIDKRGVLEEEVFTYRISKENRVFISWYGKQITVLSGKKSEEFIKRIENSDFHEKQLIMAKVTGNFKHGNEKNNK